jgi:hypothetical protein
MRIFWFLHSYLVRFKLFPSGRIRVRLRADEEEECAEYFW